MWTVAKIRADYEGWWLFSDWTEKIVEQHHYSNYEEMLKDYQSIIKKSKKYYNNYFIGKYNINAFYNNCDLNFYKDCNEDLKIFYSFIIINNKEIYKNLPKFN